MANSGKFDGDAPDRNPIFRASIIQASEQNHKAFLSKVFVMGQHFSNPQLPHSSHRNAIRQTVSLIEAIFIQIKTGQKRFMGLFDRLDKGSFRIPLTSSTERRRI